MHRESLSATLIKQEPVENESLLKSPQKKDDIPFRKKDLLDVSCPNHPHDLPWRDPRIERKASLSSDPSQRSFVEESLHSRFQENELFLVQLPSSWPIDSAKDISIHNDISTLSTETLSTSSNINIPPTATKAPIASSGSSTTSSSNLYSSPFSKKKDENQSSGQVLDEEGFPSFDDGHIGKLLLYRSGKMKLKVGNFLYDMESGTESKFLQQVMFLDTIEKQCVELGALSKRLICVPDFQALLSESDAKDYEDCMEL